MSVATDESVRRKRRVPKEVLEKVYPSLSSLAGPTGRTSQQAWVAVFNARPDAMHALLADLIKQVHATPGRIGQRVMPPEAEVDFEGLVYGEENELSLAEVLPKLMPYGVRSIAPQVGMSRTQFQRMLKGEYHPDANELRMIAKAVRKPPTFFIEYRKIMATAAFINLIEERPGIATTIYRKYLEVRLK
ncbi:MAG TPA: hypothetical protein VN108_08980 [Marmoricola sp.]|nr:hypothetical protein [Marmoricola sp.]